MAQTQTTTIQVQKETAKALREKQSYPEEPYDKIIRELLKKKED